MVLAVKKAPPRRGIHPCRAVPQQRMRGSGCDGRAESPSPADAGGVSRELAVRPAVWPGVSVEDGAVRLDLHTSCEMAV